MPRRSLPPIVLLDLDDTILSYSIGKPDFWALAIGEFEARLPARACPRSLRAEILEAADVFWSDDERAARGRQALRESRRGIVRTAFARLELPDAELAQSIADHFMDLKEAAVEPFPGAVEVLVELRQAGIRLGLVTNGSSELQRAKLLRHGLSDFFEAVVVEGELGRGKPHAIAFETALAQLGAEPHDAWMVGDNLEADIAGASAVGIFSVWHNPTGRADARALVARPDLEIRSLRELIDAPREA